uniref:Uncharacterized protein n=1 Tax=Triticum urartu TaxID=4572 RepID=A0A8R7PR43_TRIUA
VAGRGRSRRSRGSRWRRPVLVTGDSSQATRAPWSGQLDGASCSPASKPAVVAGRRRLYLRRGRGGRWRAGPIEIKEG